MGGGNITNLVLTLIMLGKLEEARQILAANWRLNAPPHANTTPRIAFLRHLIALLESQPDTPFLMGAHSSRVSVWASRPDYRPSFVTFLLRNNLLSRCFRRDAENHTPAAYAPLTGPELPVASDVAVPWDIACFIEFLKPKLGEHPAEFLTALVTALNDRTKVSALDQFPEWRNQPPVPPDTPWP